MSPSQQLRAAGPFHPGALIVATFSGPREKFWGAILDLSSEGLSLRGIDLGFFENFVSQIKAGESFTSGVVFFPMHRVERLELDLPEGDIPSLAHRFAQQTGQDAADVLTGEFLVRSGGGVVQ
jgi:hypothetical protein